MEKCNLFNNCTCGASIKPEVKPFANNDLSSYNTSVIKRG